MGDDLGAPMQRLVRDVNNLRWSYNCLRSPKGSIVLVDRQNSVVAFRREDDVGAILLIIVHLDDTQFGGGGYDIPIGDDPATWREIFNSQATEYGGDCQVRNSTEVKSTDNQLSVAIPAWSLLIFQRVSQ
jgi:1,4-alpha-glucan branching enzyme